MNTFFKKKKNVQIHSRYAKLATALFAEERGKEYLLAKKNLKTSSENHSAMKTVFQRLTTSSFLDKCHVPEDGILSWWESSTRASHYENRDLKKLQSMIIESKRKAPSSSSSRQAIKRPKVSRAEKVFVTPTNRRSTEATIPEQTPSHPNNDDDHDQYLYDSSLLNAFQESPEKPEPSNVSTSASSTPQVLQPQDLSGVFKAVTETNFNSIKDILEKTESQRQYELEKMETSLIAVQRQAREESERRYQVEEQRRKEEREEQARIRLEARQEAEALRKLELEAEQRRLEIQHQQKLQLKQLEFEEA